MACRALARAGLRVLAQNVYTPSGEVDVLCRRGRTLVAVEVKSSCAHPAPERRLAPKQLDRVEAALCAIGQSSWPLPRQLRVDVVTIRWLRARRGAPARAVIDHFRGLRRLVPSAHGVGFSRIAPERHSPKSSYEDTLRRAPPLMVSLAEQMIPRRKMLLLLSENLLFVLVILIGTSAPPLSSHSFWLFEPSMELLRGFATSFAIAIFCQAALSYNDLYDWKVAQNRADLANRLVHSYGYSLVMLGILALVAGQLFFLPGLHDINGETWKLILLVGIGFGLVFVLRNVFHWFFYKWRFGERVIVIGSSPEALTLSRMLRDNPMAGFEVCGRMEEAGQPALQTTKDDAPILGELQALHQTCRDEGISRVIVSLKERRGQFPVEALLRCRMDGVIVEEREAMYERLTGKLAVESMRPSYLIYGRGFAKDPLTLALKRVLDIFASSIGLALSLPLCLVTAALIKLTSRGPVFFVQERVGEDGEPFKLIKFRTMQNDAEAKSGPVWAQENDTRVTPIGKFLRTTRIDEIPQFLNILAGQMSFVGPRPERPHFVDQLEAEIPFYPLRHTVKPGLTGWAQVCHPYGASTEDAQEKLRYELYYIKNIGLLFDLNIILRTIAVILRGTGAR
ncbi:MAG: YraN family protein [Planctomycetota bacterium]|nr:YraN family protein [Planctomycetota bacterium]